MAIRYSFLLVLMCSVWACCEAELEPGVFDAEGVRATLLEQLPQESLRVRAAAKTLPENKQRWVDMALEWGAEPPHARYTLRDAFGAPLASLQVEPADAAGPALRFYQGDPLQGAPLPDLDAPVEEMVFSWNDLSLAFLWWPNPVPVGKDSVKGRDCYVIDCPAPPGSRYARARLWIDDKVFMMLRAAMFDDQGVEQKRMDVKSFKKIDDVWMLKDLEVTLPNEDRVTKLRVRDLERAEQDENTTP